MPSNSNPNAIATGGGRVSANSVTHTALQTGIPNTQAAGSASGILYGGGPSWHDGTTNPAGTVEGQLDKIISDLVNNAGSDRIGFAGYSYLGSGSIQDGIVELIDDLALGLNAASGATRIGAAPVGGYSPREVLSQGVSDSAGGIGDSTELTGSPTVEEVLLAIDASLRRRRAFTATVTNPSNGVRLADVNQNNLDGAIWTILSDQLSSRQGGHYMVLARDNVASFELNTSMPAGSYPVVQSEVVSNASGVFSSSLAHRYTTPLQVVNGSGTLDLRGSWNGFSFLQGTGALDTPRFEQGAHAKMCGFFGDVRFNDVTQKESRPTKFESCVFSRIASNTTDPCIVLDGGSDAHNLVFEGCLFGGGSGTNAAAVRMQNFGVVDSTLNDVPVVFRKCIFNGVGSTAAFLADSASVDQTVIFEDCEFIGDPTSTSYPCSISSNPNFHFYRCRFSGGQRLFNTSGGGSLNDCVFYTNLDRAGTVVNINPIPSTSFKISNTKVHFDGAFGTTTADSTPAISMDMRGTEIDGLSVYYLDGATALAQTTLQLDYGSNAVSTQQTSARNIFIDLNHKTVEGVSVTAPMAILATGVNDTLQHHIQNVKVIGVDQGNPAGTGAQGRLLRFSDVHVDTVYVEGFMGSAATTTSHLWDTIVEVGSDAVVENLVIRVEPASTDWMPQGATGAVLMSGRGSKLVRPWIYALETGTDTSALSFSTGLINIDADDCVVEGGTFYHDPVSRPTIKPDSDVESPCVRNNHFYGTSGVTRNHPVIEKTTGGTGEGGRYQNNTLQHSADGAGSPKAISVDQDYSMVKDNIIKRLASDGGGNLIHHVGLGSLTADNITRP